MGERGFFKKLGQRVAFGAALAGAVPHSAEAAPSTANRETASQHESTSSIEQWKSEVAAAAAKVDTPAELDNFERQYTNPFVQEYLPDSRAQAEQIRTAAENQAFTDKATALKEAYKSIEKRMGELPKIDNTIDLMDRIIAKCSPENQAARERIQQQMEALKRSGY